MYNIIDLARFVINKSIEKRIELNITKLHKFLYIIYGTYLVKKDTPVSSESPSCFRYGPIFKSVQRDYKKNILNIEEKYNFIDELNNDTFLNAVVESVLNAFGNFSAISLSNWTHRENSAWSKAEKESDYWGNEIPDEYIREEFKRVVKNV